jgi:hypothetical protein
MKASNCIAAVLAVVSLTLPPLFAAKQISKEKAREIALEEAPGRVESAELEHERGTLVYSFDIRNAKGTIDEVLVSAYTGKVVAHEHEDKAKEAAEKKQDAKAAKAKKH